MLALTPAPLQTGGERAFFAELQRWDTGNGVRAAIVASIPLVEPGPLQRRLSDAVLFVPEGIAVVRVVEVVRQSGVVTARPEGPWMIGTPDGSGSVLQLAGGGSTPLDGLMRAGMDVALRLRQADIEPGRVARLTVLVGDIDGLHPADGDLGEGDQVAILEPRSLLLGIARASRYAGADNPRLWTTADVRAALTALELEGRGPTVEELNGEGFPYSPYVLRMRSLMAPAVMAASRVEDRPAADTPVEPTPPPAAVAVPGPARPVRDTVAVDSSPPPPSGEETGETGGIGGLFTHAEPVDPAPVDPAPIDPAPVDPVPVIRPVQPRVAQAAVPTPPEWSPPPTEGDDGDGEGEGGGGSGRRTGLLVGAGLLVLVLLGVAAFLILRPDSEGNGGAEEDPGQASAPSGEEAPGPEPGDVQEVEGVTFTAQALQVDDTCVGHAYGDVATFFEGTNCTALARALYSTEVDGNPVVVSVSRVTMPDAAAARDLRALTDTSGSGNVSDLLREGVGYAGAPDRMRDMEYASAVSGPTVTIVETSWATPEAAGDSADIDRVASVALVLPVPQAPPD